MLLQVTMTLSLWSVLYFTLSSKWPQYGYEWSCRLVSAIHAVLVTCLSAYCGFVQGPWPFTDPGGPTTPLQYVTVVTSMGYFIFDFCWCIYFSTEGPTMLCHHVVSIFGLSICLVTEYYGTELIALIFGSEITNPLLQLRWFLRKFGYQDTVIAECVDVAFILGFTCIRMGVGTYLMICYNAMDHIPFHIKCGGVVFYIISVAFYITIVKFAYRKYYCKRSKVQQISRGKKDMRQEADGLQPR